MIAEGPVIGQKRHVFIAGTEQICSHTDMRDKTMLDGTTCALRLLFIPSEVFSLTLPAPQLKERMVTKYSRLAVRTKLLKTISQIRGDVG